MPMRRFSGGSAAPGRDTTLPFEADLAFLHRSKPAMQRSTVVLPQPLGPSRQPIAPRAARTKARRRRDVLVCRRRGAGPRLRAEHWLGPSIIGIILINHCYNGRPLGSRLGLLGGFGIADRALLALPVLSSANVFARRRRHLGAPRRHRAARVHRQHAAAAAGRRVRRDLHGRAERRGSSPPTAFPARCSRMGADAAARDARLRHGLRLHRLAAVHRPGADGAARGDRLAGARVLVPRRSARSAARRRCCRSRSIPTSTCSRAPRSSSCRAARSRPAGSPATARGARSCASRCRSRGRRSPPAPRSR